MILTLIGLRARTPETTAALSTLRAGLGLPHLRRRARCWSACCCGATGSYAGMFVLVLAGVVRADGHRLAHDAASGTPTTR